MRVVITGAAGQLGRELVRIIPGDFELTALSSVELDITDRQMVENVLDEIAPEVIINAAAYTAVDRAESDRKRAEAVNGWGAANLAGYVGSKACSLVHVSTDFVFDGDKSRPYLPEDHPNPRSAYGKSKLLGEKLVLERLSGRALVIRTSWLYSRYGNNFVKTMLRLMSEKKELAVISDQVGTPTWAGGLAEMIWRMIEGGVRGVHHWSDAGVASWYDFAVAIHEESRQLGLLAGPVFIRAINSSEYPLPAPRPAYSVLDKTSACEAVGTVPLHWRVSLRKMLQELV